MNEAWSEIKVGKKKKMEQIDNDFGSNLIPDTHFPSPTSLSHKMNQIQQNTNFSFLSKNILKLQNLSAWNISHSTAREYVYVGTLEKGKIKGIDIWYNINLLPTFLYIEI